ncbi:hypothetical protein J2Z31_005943 [Sinorhizobium kostiense]|uniref:Uncharacterized protein n=1 Tax=Sinorhizobium kostiense TaxID=76747 RepID=A0ABS4RAJ5_9HYPH|nr:hypothetical protein [Sinorhizobium kostiense]
MSWLQPRFGMVIGPAFELADGVIALPPWRHGNVQGVV